MGRTRQPPPSPGATPEAPPQPAAQGVTTDPGVCQTLVSLSEWTFLRADYVPTQPSDTHDNLRTRCDYPWVTSSPRYPYAKRHPHTDTSIIPPRAGLSPGAHCCPCVAPSSHMPCAQAPLDPHRSPSQETLLCSSAQEAGASLGLLLSQPSPSTSKSCASSFRTQPGSEALPGPVQHGLLTS